MAWLDQWLKTKPIRIWLSERRFIAKVSSPVANLQYLQRRDWPKRRLPKKIGHNTQSLDLVDAVWQKGNEILTSLLIDRSWVSQLQTSSLALL
jgi:hypothetical protein